MLSTVKKIKKQVGLSVPPSVGMREALQWMLLARISVLFLVLFTALTKNVVIKSNLNDSSLREGLFLLCCSFLITFVQAVFLESLIINWGWVALQIVVDATLTSLWIFWGQSGDNVFPLFYLIQILIVSLTFYRRGAFFSTFMAVVSFGIVTFTKSQSEPGAFFLWSIYSAIFVLLGWVGGFLSEELKRTSEILRKKTAEVEKLTDLQERIISEIPTGLLTVDNEMNLNFINPAAEHILGVLARDSVGKPLSQVSADLMPFFIQIEAEEMPQEEDLGNGNELSPARETSVSATGSEFHRSVFLKAKSEAGRQARLQQTVEVGKGLNKQTLRGDVAEIDIEAGIGRLLKTEAKGGRVLLFQDVTKIIHLEEKLKQHEKLAAVGQLAAGIAHEIRNPLASMSASIEMLNSSQEWTDPDNKKLMEITLKEIDRLNGLISEFLDFVKPETLKVVATSLDQILMEIITVANELREIKNVAKIQTKLTPCKALANSEKIKQVVWNLILNAAQAIPEQGIIELGCEPVSGQRVKWWVSDTGQGMTDEVLAHIYEPFFTTKAKGTGLGLPTAYKIIEAHHGEIRVSSNLGKGTCFEIFLPRA
ncbi:MAG: PAS domain-containing sensor histidine kinase [Bdellovibrionales bacterium]|nr:PAS domain-containing sensor histidine kinase [Bdellovibrionales bacterium]